MESIILKLKGVCRDDLLQMVRYAKVELTRKSDVNEFGKENGPRARLALFEQVAARATD